MKAPIRKAALVVMLAGSLAACGSFKADNAVTVNGQTFTETDVQATTQQLAPSFQNLTTAQTVQTLAVAPVILDLANTHGIVVTDEAALAALPGVRDAEDGTLEIARSIVAWQRLTQSVRGIEQEFQQAVGAADIELNPRYGSFNPKTGFGPANENWIANPPTGAPDTPR